MHPILVHFGDNFFIGTYGLMIALGMIAALGLSAWLGKRRGFRSEIFFDLVFLALVSGFIGGRILYIIVNFGSFLDDPGAMIFSRTGFVFLGGFIAAAATLSWYVFSRKLDFWKLADIAGSAVAIGHAFGRIGCHLAGCCFGATCSAPIGVSFPRVSMPDGGYWSINAWYDQFERGLIPEDALHSLPVWPTQLMESGSLLLLSGFLVAMLMFPMRKGNAFGAYLVGYAVIRFTLEFFRGDVERGLWLGGLLSTSQIISIAMFLGGFAVFITAKRREVVQPVIEDNTEETEQDDEEEKGTVSHTKKRKKARRSKVKG